MIISTQNRQLIAIFSEDGFTLDYDPSVAKGRLETIMAKEDEIYRQY